MKHRVMITSSGIWYNDKKNSTHLIPFHPVEFALFLYRILLKRKSGMPCALLLGLPPLLALMVMGGRI